MCFASAPWSCYKVFYEGKRMFVIIYAVRTSCREVGMHRRYRLTLTMKIKLKKAQTQRLIATSTGSQADGSEWKVASFSATMRF